MILGAITIFISAFLIISFPLNKNFLRNPIFWVLSGLTLHLAFFASIFYLLFQPWLKDHLDHCFVPLLAMPIDWFVLAYQILLETLKAKVQKYNIFYDKKYDLENDESNYQIKEKFGPNPWNQKVNLKTWSTK